MSVGYCGFMGHGGRVEGLDGGRLCRRGEAMKGSRWKDEDRNCEIVSEGRRNQISFILLPLDSLIKS